MDFYFNQEERCALITSVGNVETYSVKVQDGLQGKRSEKNGISVFAVAAKCWASKEVDPPKGFLQAQKEHEQVEVRMLWRCEPLSQDYVSVSCRNPMRAPWMGLNSGYDA